MPSSSARYHLLLAEDNPVSRALACKLLQKKGHEVVTVDNGLEAWEAYCSNRFDAILMDLEMPLMSGIEACAKIRKHELENRTQAIPIIALTAHDEGPDREACQEAGMNAFIPKPINIRSIQETLQNLISGNSG